MVETRDALIDHTERLLAERSYNGFSYTDLSDVLGIRKPSIHYHFPKKSDLVLAVVERFVRGFAGWTEEQRGRPPGEQLESYFALFEHFVRRGQGCPHATLAAEAGALPPEILAALRRLSQQHVDWLADVLRRGRQDGAFEFQGPLDATAWLLASAVQGAVTTARTMGAKRYRQIVDQQARLLGRAS